MMEHRPSAGLTVSSCLIPAASAVTHRPSGQGNPEGTEPRDGGGRGAGGGGGEPLGRLIFPVLSLGTGRAGRWRLHRTL